MCCASLAAYCIARAQIPNPQYANPQGFLSREPFEAITIVL
jgi:hypothetical protein